MNNAIAYFFMSWSLGGLFFFLVGKQSGRADGLRLAQRILSGPASAASKPEAGKELK